MVRAHSIGRVSISSEDVPVGCSETQAIVEEVIERVDEQEDYRDAQWDYEQAISSLVHELGYGSVGDSNSVWGRQQRLITSNSSNPAQESKLRKAVTALGAIAQDSSDPYEGRDMNVFAPDVRRYLPFDHPLNAPESDVVIAEHSDYKGTPTHVEVGGPDEIFEMLSGSVRPTAEFRDADVCQYSASALPFIEECLQEEAVSYSLFASTINRLPLMEWTPSLATDEYVAVKEDPGFDTTYRVHAIRDDGFACGATVGDKQEFRRLRVETAERHISMRNTDGWCGHQACQSRFADIRS